MENEDKIIKVDKRILLLSPMGIISLVALFFSFLFLLFPFSVLMNEGPNAFVNLYLYSGWFSSMLQIYLVYLFFRLLFIWFVSKRKIVKKQEEVILHGVFISREYDIKHIERIEVKTNYVWLNSSLVITYKSGVKKTISGWLFLHWDIQGLRNYILNSSFDNQE